MVTDDDPKLTGLAMLLLDVLAGDPAELALLARYARAPEQLGTDERSHLELRISASPALADQLRVLRRLASSDESGGGTGTPPSQEAPSQDPPPRDA